MKRFFLFSVLLLATIVIMAEGIDRQSALEKAKKFMPGKQFVAAETVPSARRAIANKTDAFYVFNAEDNAGYVIVSGDDRTTEILGYAENGNLDIDHIPDNMKWWLDNYARQIKALGTSLTPAKSDLGMRRAAAIQPLIQSKWGQDAPYNYMCPDGNYVDYDEAGYNTNNRCPTGCVATAMAQIMYYWKWPESCPALSEYSKTKTEYDGTRTELNLKGLPATTFKWDKMKDLYTVYDENDESAMAVAELMRYCGQAVEMGYSPSGSGASVYEEMVSVFNYNANLHRLTRNSYTAVQWEGIIYEELAAHRPVLYSGQNVEDGHQFIVDGYDGNGLFHINWGWGGYPDNYFVLSIADPDSPGETTGTDQAFDMDQVALVGVKPAEKDEIELPSVYCAIDEHLVSTYGRNSSADSFVDVVLDGYCYWHTNKWPRPSFSIEVGWGLYQGDAFIKCLASREFPSQYNNTRLYNKMTVTFGADLTEGTYHLYQIYRFDGETEWRLCNSYGIESLTADITSTSLTLRKPIAEGMAFEVLSMNVPDDAEAGSDLNIQVNVKNTGRIEYLDIGLWVQKQGESEWKNTAVTHTYWVGKGKTEKTTLKYVPEEGGTYQLKITAGNSDEALITSSVNIASTVKQVVDGVTYLCTPKYGRATVIRNDNFNRMTSVNILSSIKVDEVECKVKTIGDYAFYNWLYLESVTIPEGIEEIGSHAFFNCQHVTSLTLPEGLEVIGKDAFYGMSKLTELVLPSSLKIIDDSALGYLTSIKTLVIPEGVEKLGHAVFWYMNNLTRLELPGSLKSIGGQVIEGCSKLEHVSSHTDHPITVEDYTFCLSGQDFPPSPATLYVPIGAKANYEAIPGWTKFAAIVESEDVRHGTINKYKLTYMVDGAEYKSYEVEYGATITPETAPTKEGYTFSGWSEIPATMPAHDVTITGTFTQIDYVVGETTYEIQNDEVSVKDGSKLSGNVEIQTTVVINDQTYKVTSIADNAFKGNTAITSVTIPNSITQIGTNAFEGCTSLSEINIGNAVSSIGSKAFANITSASNAPRRAPGTGLRISCYSESVPSTASNAFENTSISNGTLLVEDNSVTAYKNSAPWNGFGTIMGFKEATGIEKIWSDENGEAKMFSIDGKPINTPQKGAVIIRMNNGETRKVVVK